MLHAIYKKELLLGNHSFQNVQYIITLADAEGILIMPTHRSATTEEIILSVCQVESAGYP